MDKRRTELSELGSYIQTIDNEVTMILQSLQWDRKHLIEDLPMVTCKYDPHHRVPPDKLEPHEEECYLRSLGYSVNERWLPEPLDVNATTLVTLSKNDIANIIEYAAKVDPSFKKAFIFTNSGPFLQCIEYVAQDYGANCRGPQDSEPKTLQRLEETYSMDERRVIHDAVVTAVPSCHDLMELALPSGDSDKPQADKPKSRAQILAELRDMKRRRTKYRVPTKSRNYSDVLRDVIATQMEHYSELSDANSSKDKNTKDNINKIAEVNYSKKYEQVHVKTEPVDDGHYARDHDSRPRHKSKDKYKERGREKRYDDYNKRDKHRDRYSGSSKERSRDKKDYRSTDKHRRDNQDQRREYKGHHSKSSRHSDRQSERQYYDSYERPHREKYKRYYDIQDDSFESIKKRIKQEKD